MLVCFIGQVERGVFKAGDEETPEELPCRTDCSELLVREIVRRSFGEILDDSNKCLSCATSSTNRFLESRSEKSG